jgi:hypothetical protein
MGTFGAECCRRIKVTQRRRQHECAIYAAGANSGHDASDNTTNGALYYDAEGNQAGGGLAGRRFYRKSSLFDRFLTFDVRTELPQARRH